MRQEHKGPNEQAEALGLRADHRHLDHRFDEFIARTASGDWRDCDAIWDGFSSALEQHMTYEERSVFPAYERTSVSAAEVVHQLREEHKELRQRLANIGVAIQLHAARAEEMKELVSVLREHVERESQSIYPWLDTRASQRETPFGTDEALI